MTNTRNDRKYLRRKEAVMRQETWTELTHSQKLTELDNRLGKGIGAKKQRARIAKAIKKEKIKS